MAEFERSVDKKPQVSGIGKMRGRGKKETQPRYESNVGSLCSARLLRKFRE